MVDGSPQKPYVHQDYPKRMYRDGIDDSMLVQDPDEEESALADGYRDTYAPPEAEGTGESDAEGNPKKLGKPKKFGK